MGPKLNLSRIPVVAKLLMIPAVLVCSILVLAILVTGAFNRTNEALDRLMHSAGEHAQMVAQLNLRSSRIQSEMYRTVGLMANELGTGQIRESGERIRRDIDGLTADLTRFYQTEAYHSDDPKVVENVVLQMEKYRAVVAKTTRAFDSGMPIAVMFMVGVDQESRLKKFRARQL